MYSKKSSQTDTQTAPGYLHIYFANKSSAHHSSMIGRTTKFNYVADKIKMSRMFVSLICFQCCVIFCPRSCRQAIETS